MDLELQAAEKQAFHRAALEDGILDILCGLCLVAWGFLVEAGQAGLGGITFAVIYPTGFAIRKRLIAPRIGHVTLKEQTVRSKRLLMIGLFTFTAVAGLALYLASDTEAGDFRARMESLGAMVLAFPLASDCDDHRPDLRSKTRPCLCGRHHAEFPGLPPLHREG